MTFEAWFIQQCNAGSRWQSLSNWERERMRLTWAAAWEAARLEYVSSEELAALRKDRASLNSMATLLAEARRERDAALGRAVPPHRSGGPDAPREEPAAARIQDSRSRLTEDKCK